MQTPIWLIIINSICLFSYQQAITQEKISRNVLGNGGAEISGTNFRIVGTIGQPVIGKTANQQNQNEIGFWYAAVDIITTVDLVPEVLPKEFRLDQNYPNPFNPMTTIQFAIPKSSEVTLKIFDVLGREVATLVEEKFDAGEYKVIFEANGLPSGVYFYQINALSSSTGSSRFTQSKKLILMK